MKETKNLIDPMQFDDEQKPLTNPMQFRVPTKALEDKLYFIFFYIFEDGTRDEVTQQFEICRGRTAAYRKIQEYLNEFNLETEQIDMGMSFVLTETKEIDLRSGDEKYFVTGPDDRVSIYAFCKMLEGYFGNMAFDIDEYKHNEDGTEDDDREFGMYISELYHAHPEEPEFLMVDESDKSMADELRRLQADGALTNIFGGYMNDPNAGAPLN